MFTLITVTATSGFFSLAGEYRESHIYTEATAADALRIARKFAKDPFFRVVGIRVGYRRKSPILWVK